MSLFKRHPHPDHLSDDADAPIDPDLRLRTVRTAASTIAESIRTELRAERRTARRKRSLFFRRDKRPKTADSAVSDATIRAHIPGQRRNIYINAPLAATEVDPHGQPLARYPRNKVRTSSESPATRSRTRSPRRPGYTLLTFLPKNLFEQFHR
jgi:phospholipid-translocating ATPase